jgi:hypothetical protein
MMDEAKTAKFKVVKQPDVVVEVEVGSPVYERISKLPKEYIPDKPIDKEPDRPPIIDGDAVQKVGRVGKKLR